MKITLQPAKRGFKRICVDGICKEVPAADVLLQYDGDILELSISEPHASSLIEKLRENSGSSPAAAGHADDK